MFYDTLPLLDRTKPRPVIAQDTDYFRLHDHGYIALWDKRDSPIIEKIFTKIRQAAAVNDDEYAERYISNFESRLEKHYQDQTIAEGIEPLETGFKDDMVTKLGISALCKLCTKQRDTRFTFFLLGTSSVAEAPYQNALGAEVIRVSLETSGFQHGGGTAIRYGGFYNDAVATGTYREGGVADKETVSGQVLLFRSVYDTPISHTVSVTSVTTTQSLQFVEVQT